MADRRVKRKEAIILAIDIGKNSKQRDSDGRTYFEKSIYCASMIIKRKILTKSEDHLALILFGSSHTINHLSSQGSCYGSIETVVGLGKATWDLFNRVNSLSPTNITHSDWISTFVLAADFLRNGTENKVFAGLQIVMFSNLTTDISFNNIDIIASCLKMENIRLSILGKHCEASSLNPSSLRFLKTTGATAVNFDSVLPKMSYYKQKEVTAKSWNAPLSYGDFFDIKVYGYEKIDVTTKSSNWLFSKNYDTQDLTTAKKKHSDDNGEQMEVDNKLPTDNFYFGDEIIPVIDLDTDECTYIVSGRRCLQVLGFVKATLTQRSFLMNGGSYIFKPHKTDIIAFNAIFKSMVKRREVMIVRKVDLYINLLNIGALFPEKIENEKFFVYVSLPYDEDNNYAYKLPSLDSIKLHLKEKIALKRRGAMDIDIDNRNTFAIPENRCDLELQSMYDCIVQQILTKIIPKKIRSKKTLKHRKSLREFGRPNLQNFINKFSFKQEFFENCGPGDNNMQFDHYEEFDVSNELRNPPQSSIKNAEPPLNECVKTFSIKQEVFEDFSAEDNNSIHFGYGEELNVSNELINPPQSSIENAEPPLNELRKSFSIKQEVFENGSSEDINTTHFGYDNELDVSNELRSPPKSFIENAEPPLNECVKTFSIKQEIFEDGSSEDIKSIHFGYGEELNVSNELINPLQSSIENAEPPLNECVNTFSLKQEVFENSSDEDNNTTKVDQDEKLDVSKQCVITLLNPIEDFNKLLKNGFDSAIVCEKMQFVTLNLIEESTSLEDLMKPIAALQALREYYIINDDAKSYNNFMYFAKDTLLMSRKGNMWSKFINSGIGMITNAEIEASDISQESSEEFKKLSGDFDIDFNIDDDSQLKE